MTRIRVDLPVKDVNLYFKRHTPEEFEQLLKAANPLSLEQSEAVRKREQRFYTESGHGFVVGDGDRQYEIKGIHRSETQLKVTLKASAGVSDNQPLELSTIDSYSSRSRHWFGKLCAGLFGAAEALVKEDIGKILNLVEGYRPPPGRAPPSPRGQARGFASKEVTTTLTLGENDVYSFFSNRENDSTSRFINTRQV